MIVGRRIASIAVVAGAALAAAAQARAAPSLQPRFGPPLPGASQNPAPVTPGATAAPALPQAPGVTFRTVEVAGAYGTQVVTVTDSGVVGGNYYKDKGALSHGFIQHGHRLVTVDYPGTSGVTSLDGMNNRGVAVGTYADGAGTDDG